MADPVFILGGYQSDFARCYAREGLDYSDLMVEAVRGALADADLDASEIGAVHVGNAMGELYNGQAHMGPIVAQVVPELRGVPTMRHEGACASSSLAILAASSAIQAGWYDCALVLGVEQERVLPGIEAAQVQNSAGWLDREGFDCNLMWAAVFGRMAQEYGERYGLDRRHLNRIAEINYANAKDNPRAQTRFWQFAEGAFSEDDELNPVVEPGTRRSDCTHITDGACALVLASSRFAREHLKKTGRRAGDIARIRGWGHRGAGIRFLDKLEASRGEPYIMPHVRQTITDAWRRAGIPGIEAVSGIETHDCFTTTEYMAIDHFGITAPGQSWQAVEEGWIERNGRIPVNSSGGLIGIGHPIGATGARMTLDAARQVTNRAGAYQVPGAKIYQTLNIGGSCATVVSLVLDTVE